jgi:hypothetical protein
LIVRQNRHENELAFNAAAANLIMQPSLVLARHILLFLLMPSLGRLLRFCIPGVLTTWKTWCCFRASGCPPGCRCSGANDWPR